MTETAIPEPRRCPQCNTPMRRIESGRADEEAWVCNVMLMAIERGLIGQPGRKHAKSRVWVWKRAA